MTASRGEITHLLREFQQDSESREKLSRLIYQDIRAITRRRLLGSRQPVTLQTTAVVHEAFLKLFKGSWEISDRKHLMHLMGRAVRQVIVDHARMRQSKKRGSDPVRTGTGVDQIQAPDTPTPDTAEQDALRVLDLEAALEHLEEVEPELADIVSAHYYAGYTLKELAEITGISRRTLQRRLDRARVWLRFELNQEYD